MDWSRKSSTAEKSACTEIILPPRSLPLLKRATNVRTTTCHRDSQSPCDGIRATKSKRSRGWLVVQLYGHLYRSSCCQCSWYFFSVDLKALAPSVSTDGCMYCPMFFNTIVCLPLNNAPDSILLCLDWSQLHCHVNLVTLKQLSTLYQAKAFQTIPVQPFLHSWQTLHNLSVAELTKRHSHLTKCCDCYIFQFGN